ncbi:hypothetical protein [Streptomyces angustmyceticus]|uniref:hypothetical protein n=1 Tax=Streptomyces angustmyceticus TaxID=285578 RepID=UPI003D9244D0
MPAPTELLEPVPPTALSPVLSMSVVCLDQTRLGAHIETLRTLGISRLHVDLIDPAFGRNVGLPLETISDLAATCGLPIDVHAMLHSPGDLLEQAAQRGAATVCVHQRTVTPEVMDCLRRIASGPTEVGLVVDPGEGIDRALVERLEPAQLTVMSVEPGGAGRPFRDEALLTLAEAAELRERGTVRRVEADGAVGPATVARLVSAGAGQLVLGSTVFPQRGPAGNRLDELALALSALSPA